MNQGRRRDHKALLTIVGLAGALGACEGEQVLVGTTRESLHLNVCMGAHTNCEPDLETELLMNAGPRSCAAELGPELEPEFVINFSELPCGASGECFGVARNLTVAADGTSWILVTDVGDPWDASGLWLLRIGTQGELLSWVDAMHGMIAPPNHSVRQEMALALDERGHAFVLIYEMDGGPNADSPLVERSWLTEYDADGEIASGPSLMTGIGVPQLSIATDGTLVIAANGIQNARHGVLASLDLEGELLWSQNGVRTNGQGIGYGVSGLAANDYDSFVLAERNRGSGDLVEYGLTRYDADGNALWDRMLPPQFMYATLVGAGDALLISALKADRVQNWIGRVDEGGQLEWAYNLSGTGIDIGVGDLAIDLDRDVALTARTGLAQSELMEISLDGQRCVRHALPEELNTFAAHVATDGTGAVHMMSQHFLARVRLPDE